MVWIVMSYMNKEIGNKKVRVIMKFQIQNWKARKIKTTK